ncbi:MAG: hypothetical protein E7365_03725 [Clostridiales bacterium]|nr:hypothetical protein [Clostridiales bacterium]
MKKRIFSIIALSVAFILAVYGILSVVTLHNNAFFSPDYPEIDLTKILLKDEFADEDYKTLFYQTGLGKYAIDSIKNDDDFVEIVKSFQSNFFKKHNVECVREAITTCMEYNTTENGAYTQGFEIFQAKPGYVLIMEASHSFGWRHGHTGLVVDKNSVLEAPIIFEPTSIYGISSWTYYPNFIMLRLKDATDEQLALIAKDAKDDLLGITYSPLAGVFNKKQGNAPKTVQCAYLVWYSFYKQGINIDKNGDSIVTVQNIKNSDMFEVVQIYGYNPSLFM